MAAKDIEPHKFPKGKTGNPNGRPPKVLTGLVSDLKAQGYERATATTVTETIEHLIGLPQDRLNELLADKDQPMSVRIIIKSLLGAKGFETLSAILDRAHGKPRQAVEMSGDAANPLQIVINEVAYDAERKQSRDGAVDSEAD